MTTTLLLGGTFDPVHYGHLKSALELSNIFPDSKVVLVPCAIPAHRELPEVSAEDRFAMLKLAIEEYPELAVDDCEIHREGTSYTIDTLKEYRQRLGEDARLVFVMGSDAWPTLPTWHDWQQFTDLAHILVLKRPGLQAEEPRELSTWAEGKRLPDDSIGDGPAGSIGRLSLSQIPVSATEIREVLASKGAKEGLMPDKVNRYIREHHLYLS